MQYEKRVQKHLRTLDLGKVHCNEWIEFWDANGPGSAEPDMFLLFPSRVVLFDAKLSAKAGYWPQLEGLYAPLLEHIYERPVVSAQIGRHVERGLGADIFPDVISFLRSDAKRGVVHLTI